MGVSMNVSVELPDDLVIQLVEQNDAEFDEIVLRALDFYRLSPEADLTLYEAGRIEETEVEQRLDEKMGW